MLDVLGQIGFSDVRLVRNFDCFRGTSKQDVARKFGVEGANIFGRKS